MTSCSSLFDVLQQRATRTPKATAFSVVDSKGKIKHLTYRALLKQSLAVAAVLHGLEVKKNSSEADFESCEASSGDRVGLVYCQKDAASTISHLIAVFGCYAAGVVPVSLGLPDSLDDNTAVLDRMGFFLAGCGVKLALTGAAGYKMLYDRKKRSYRKPRLNWPDMEWINTSKLPRARKTVVPFAPHSGSTFTPAYIEYDESGDNVRGVVVTHHQAFHLACTLHNSFDYRPDGKLLVACPGLWGPGFHHGISYIL